MQSQVDGGCDMQTRSQEFRAQATECQELADHSRELMKEQYEQLVHQWLFLAEHVKPKGNSGQFRCDPRT